MVRVVQEVCGELLALEDRSWEGLLKRGFCIEPQRQFC